MSSSDYSIANQSGAAFRAELNTTLSAVVSNNSKATEPSDTFAYMWWADTGNALLKIRNAANNAWVTLGTLDADFLGLADHYTQAQADALLAAKATVAAFESTGIDDNATNTSIIINADGIVTKPYQPSFDISGTSGSYTSGTLPFENATTNVGNNFNTTSKRFVAPVDGYYCFSIQYWCDPNTIGAVNVLHNGAIISKSGREGIETYYDARHISFSKYLDEDDYIEAEWWKGSVHLNSTYSFFSGYLVG